MIFTACGMLLGLGASQTVLSRFPDFMHAAGVMGVWMINGFSILLFGIIFNFIYSKLEDRGNLRGAKFVSEVVQKIPIEELIPGIVGLILGAFAASLISNILMGIRALSVMYLNVVLSVLLYVGLGYYGWTIAQRTAKFYKDKIPNIFQGDILRKRKKERGNAVPKVFDTSVIIDGRIQEILKTGFIEGDIIIPDFVLVELRHISDSADELKRNRGRRGLDILAAIQEEHGIEIYDTAANKDIAKIPEVDLKLLKLAEILGGVVVTNDYNLNKVAQVQEIGILNINELANTLKPIALPGEVMRVTPVKEGKTEDQSVAYLDDGTMVVVQGGRKLIGKTVNVTVTSVLQTAAGRMIFVKP